MFLHAGAGAVVRGEEILGVFDLDGKMTTADTAAFLRKAEREGRTELAGDDLPKCFVLCAPRRDRRGVSAPEGRVLFSRLSASALAHRGELL
ncbi:MAG: DUF370 domain-containing protein [Clostridia bacterium]|jgi:hypothetical protein|nr:DUF370 domain-containing protein [Clostridia bacterium]